MVEANFIRGQMIKKPRQANGEATWLSKSVCGKRKKFSADKREVLNLF